MATMSSDEEYGELVVTSLLDARSLIRLRIDRTDPRVRIIGPLVREALGSGPGWLSPGAELSSDRLVIHGENGRVVYRIGAYHPEPEDFYEAEWPD
jgi:hypothetical protein